MTKKEYNIIIEKVNQAEDLRDVDLSLEVFPNKVDPTLPKWFSGRLLRVDGEKLYFKRKQYVANNAYNIIYFETERKHIRKVSRINVSTSNRKINNY